MTETAGSPHRDTSGLPDDVADLLLLQQTLSDILSTGTAPRRPRRSERTAADRVVYEPISGEGE